MLGLQMFLGAPLAVKSAKAKPDDPAGEFVKIEARKPGLGALILTVLRLKPSSTFTMTREGVRFTASSLFGRSEDQAPLSSISSTHCGHSKPVKAMVVGVLLALAGVFEMLTNTILPRTGLAPGGIACLISIVLIAYYVRTRTPFFYIQTHGTRIMGMRFRSTKTLDASAVVEIINGKIAEPRG